MPKNTILDLRTEQNKIPSQKKVVILLGAGSTRANADNVPDYEKPPLNKKFFSDTRSSVKKVLFDFKDTADLLESIRVYCEKKYGQDVFSETGDDLEHVMSQIFADVKNPASRSEAYPIFRNLLALIQERIGITTNNISINNKKPLYHLIEFYFNAGISPKNLTIISFNYDIYLEKTLALLSGSRYGSRFNSDGESVVFLLQYCYEINSGLPTRPSKPREGYFPIYLDVPKGGTKILKLHGSLNWYSYYPSKDIDLEAMLDQDREVKISGEKDLKPNQLRYIDQKRNTHFTLPVIVPPVNNKREIYHSNILDLWALAETALIDADEFLIYGYSCPSSDTDSKALLQNALNLNSKIEIIPIIDPDETIKNRYQQLIPNKSFRRYDNVFHLLEGGSST